MLLSSSSLLLIFCCVCDHEFFRSCSSFQALRASPTLLPLAHSEDKIKKKKGRNVEKRRSWKKVVEEGCGEGRRCARAAVAHDLRHIFTQGDRWIQNHFLVEIVGKRRHQGPQPLSEVAALETSK